MITFDQTVPRALVDRGDATTVLITSWERTGNRLTAGAVWSRLGGYYQLLDEQRHDPLLVLETIRQGALLLAHVIDDVPLATMQILRSSRFDAEPDGLKITDAPTEVVLTIEAEHLEPDAQSIMQTSLRCELHRDGSLIGSGGGRAIIPPHDRYLKVRGRDPETVVLPVSGLDAGMPARAVGKASDRDVVIAPGARPGAYRLRVDARHPNFFDNPTDHTPGMLLIEAMRQAVVAESGDPGCAPLAMAARFHRFVELDHPGEVLVRRTDSGFQTDVRQFDKLAARADWPSAGHTHG
ncbi:ScbA/BarX family gamma-butyrolactone biosynthesis protein [Actinomycetes bacterium KLBMP 9797]